MSDKPTWFRTATRSLPDGDVVDPTDRYHKMMGSLYAVDEMIDGLLTSLDDKGELSEVNRCPGATTS